MSRARIHTLATAISRLVDPDDELHQRLCRETPHMSPETMSKGLITSLTPWDEIGLSALYAEEQAYCAGGVPPQLCLVVLGGVLPPSHIQAMAYPYLLGSELIVKYPSRDPLFASIFAEALGDDLLIVERLGFGGVWSRADAAVAVGDDESINAISRHIAAATPMLRFGHRTAIGIVMGAAVARSRSTAHDIALSIGTFDQLGCLSPREILVVGGEADAAALGEGIGQELATLPLRCSLGLEVESSLRSFRETGLAGDLPIFGPDDLQWGVQVRVGGTYEGTPGGRHVIVRAVESLSVLPEVLTPIAGRISAVGLAGGPLDPATSMMLVRYGASRIVDVGQLQSPPPTWPHDGCRPLASLCRWFSRD
jgi:hypothetical protein